MSCFYYCLLEVSLTLTAILRYCDVRTAGSSRCCVRVSHVCGVGLLPVDGTIWNGVRICDKLQIYLGVAHWRIDWAPCDRMRNASSGERSWLSSSQARSEDAQPKITSKIFLFLALSVIMMAQHDLKEVDAVSDPWCWQRWKKKKFFVGSAVTEMWTSSHLALWTKSGHWLAKHSFPFVRAKVAPSF